MANTIDEIRIDRGAGTDSSRIAAVAFFVQRTKKHIELVRQSIHVLLDAPVATTLDLVEMGTRAQQHDMTKFAPPELEPYIWKTWWFHKKDSGEPYDGALDPLNQWDDAVRHHFARNDHHPEYWTNVGNMSLEAVAEMACDWNAMGLEKGTDPLKWYEDNVERFSFPPHIDAQVRNFLNILRSK